MFRRPMAVRRRVGAPLLRSAIVGGTAYAVGKSAQRGAYREDAQEQRLNELEQQRGAASAQSGYPQMQPAYPASSQQTYQNIPPASSSQTAPAPAAPPQAGQEAQAPDKLAKLKTLGELRKSGVLTDSEFEAEKQKILRS